MLKKLCGSNRVTTLLFVTHSDPTRFEPYLSTVLLLDLLISVALQGDTGMSQEVFNGVSGGHRGDPGISGAYQVVSESFQEISEGFKGVPGRHKGFLEGFRYQGVSKVFGGLRDISECLRGFQEASRSFRRIPGDL